MPKAPQSIGRSVGRFGTDTTPPPDLTDSHLVFLINPSLVQAGYGDGAAGLWVMLFTVSKVFELVDTVILVLKGKDPMFLHWCVGAAACQCCV